MAHLPTSCSLMRTATSKRSFSSSGAILAPKNVNKQLWRKKGAAVGNDEKGGASGSSVGNVLESVTLRPPDLKHLSELKPDSLDSTAIGSIRAFPQSTLSSFKSLTIPTRLEKELANSPRPAMIVRSATLQIKDLIDDSRGKRSAESRTIILNGPAGSGKSVLMLQALSYAQSSGWIVLYLPSATPLINSSTPHVYSSARALFDQPQYASTLLTRFAQSNKSALSSLKTSTDYTFGDRKIPAGKSLFEISTQSATDERSAPLVLEAVFEELSRQNSKPVLLAIDDVQGLLNTSKYVDPTYRKLESFDLALPRLLLEYISGKKSFNNGSVLVSPSSLSAFPSPALEEHLTSSPYPAYSSLGQSHQTYSSLTSSLRIFNVPMRLEKKEALGIVELLGMNRSVRDASLDDATFLKKFLESDGAVGAFRKSWEKNEMI